MRENYFHLARFRLSKVVDQLLGGIHADRIEVENLVQGMQQVAEAVATGRLDHLPLFSHNSGRFAFERCNSTHDSFPGSILTGPCFALYRHPFPVLSAGPAATRCPAG
jgi:hypothetical protein